MKKFAFLNKCDKFLKLSRNEKAWLLKAGIVLPLTQIGLRIFGLKRFQAFLGQLVKKNRNLTEPDTQFLTSRLAELVAIAANNGLGHANCLQRSLVLWWLLQHEGIKSELHFGMKKENQEIKGHAWIEQDGKVLNDDSDVSERYVRLGNL